MKQIQRYSYIVLFFTVTQLALIANDYSQMPFDELKETLMIAIHDNNHDKVSTILQCPEGKNFTEYDLRKALNLAAKNNSIDIARRLIQAGADIKERYNFALQDAAAQGYTEMIKILLPVSGCDKRDYSQCFYADINYFNINREEALMKAVKHGHVGVMKELIKAGANINYQNYWDSILITAVKNNRSEAIKVLVQAQVNVNTANNNGEQALGIAMRIGDIHVIRELLMAPEIEISSYDLAQIQRNYEDYLKKSDLMKSLNPENNKKIVEIYELFKPFIEKRKK